MKSQTPARQDVDHGTEVKWSKKLFVASTFSILGFLSVGIFGGYTIYTQNKTTQKELSASQARADAATKAQAAILIMGKAEVQLVSASDLAQAHTAAVLAIQASSTLDESIQRLEQTLAGSAKVAELSRLLEEIGPTKMAVIRAVRANQGPKARSELGSMQDAMSRIERISGELVQEESTRLLSAVANQGKQARATLRVLGTLFSCCVALSLFVGRELRKRTHDLANALGEINRLHDQLKQENTRMGAELEVTQRLQQMILPRNEDMRKITSLDISGSMEPATEVGGDYYDVVCQDGAVVFVIGDVTGHGLESGVIAIMVQTAVRTLLASGQYESRKFLNVLNRVVYDNVRRMRCDRNLTLSLLRYQDRLVTISGQHEEVLVVRGNGDLEKHDTLNLGFPLGLEEDISSFISEETVPLRSGDVMVAYTDGITEAMNCASVPFGVERLCEALRTSHAQPADEIRKAVLSSLREYIGGQQLLDDISLLVIKSA